jgi:C1A family cysteine protease
MASGKAGSSSRLLKAVDLPSSWDSREHGWVTPVRDQSPWGTCWTFASFATLETQLLKSGRGEWDFSEKNMASLNGFDIYFDDGGNYDMASAYLLRWGGAVMESNDVYRTDSSSWNGNPSVPMRPALHVQNVVWVPGRQTFTDNDTLKTAIMEYGAVAVSYYHEETYCTSAGAYYCNVNKDDNHAVTVVGWDDVYSRVKFKSRYRPPGDGAWLVKNSWGTEYGNEGYLYISYYDVKFAKADGVVYIPAAEGEDYTAVYGYDKLGVVAVDEASDYSLVAAAFTSAWNEELAAVGVYALEAPKSYTLSIYTNVQRGASSPVSGGVLARSQSGTIERTGYTTIHLEEPVALADGSNFSVVYAPGGTTHYHCVCMSWSEYSSCSPQRGNTYFASTNNVSGETVTNWIDAVEHPDAPLIACLKAYTRTTRAAEDKGAMFSDDGTIALDDLATTNAAAYAQFGETFGAFSDIVGANGLTLWTSWVVGFNPADAADRTLNLSIDVSGGVPSLFWTPDLGSQRAYKIWGRDDLSGASPWRVVPRESLGETSAKFFKVTVAP